MQTKKQLMRKIATLLLLCSGLAHADLKSSVIESCQAYQGGKDNNQVNACTLYIDGFIDSSLQETNAKVEQKSEKSDYMQRVYRTRTFGRSDKNANDVAQQSFCLPKSNERLNIAVDVAKAIDIEQLQHADMKSVVLETLINRYPCNGKSMASL